MKLLKRFITITLTAAIMLSLLAVNVNAESGSYDEEVSKLISLNILLDKDFSTEEFVTRKELAKYLCYLYRLPRNGINDVSNFYDVPANNEYASYISYVTKLDNIPVENEHFFRPDETVTFEVAIHAMVSALGYDAQEKDGIAYISLAQSKGIISGISFSSGDKIKKGELAKLMWNTTCADLMQAVSYGDIIQKESVKKQNMLSVYHDIYKTKGTITATERTGLDKNKPLSKGYIRLDETEYCSGVDGLDEYIGQRLEVYYRDDEKTLPTVLWAKPTDDNMVYEIKDDDIISVNNNSVTYDNGIKRKKVRYSDVVNVIYNGTYRAEYTLGELKPEIGRISLIDSDGNDIAETIIVSSYITYVVSSVDTNESIIYDKSYQHPLKLDESVQHISFRLEGKVSDISQLREEDVLLVASDAYDILNGIRYVDSENASDIEILISRKQVYGTISEYDADGNYTIDNQVYKVSKDYERARTLALGIDIKPAVTANFYIDYYGNIAWADAADNSLIQGKCAYLTKAGYGNGLESVQLKVFDKEASSWKDLTCAEKVDIDGNTIKSQKKIFDWLNQDESGTDKGYVAPRMIMYKTNEDGEVNYIDTGRLGEGETKEESLYPENAISGTMYYNLRVFQEKLMLSEKASVLIVPIDTSNNVDADNAAGYKWTNYTAFSDDSSYNILPYNLDDSSVTNLVICYKNTKGEEDITIPMCMISENVGIYYDDQAIRRITLMGTEGKKQYYLDEKAVIKDKNGNMLKNEDLKVGDVVTFSESQGYINSITQRFTLYLDNGSVVPVNYSYINGYLYIYHVAWGRAYSTGNGCLRVLYDNVINLDNSRVYNSSGVKIIIYNKKKNKVYGGSMEDIRDYIKTKDISDTTMLLTQCKYMKLSVLFAFELN